jgi:hypothetical protein
MQLNKLDRISVLTIKHFFYSPWKEEILFLFHITVGSQSAFVFVTAREKNSSDKMKKQR